jgi:glutathione S-transferase
MPIARLIVGCLPLFLGPCNRISKGNHRRLYHICGSATQIIATTLFARYHSSRPIAIYLCLMCGASLLQVPKDMIELYHCVDARSFRALWALEEMKIAYRLYLLPFPPRVLQPEYLEQNPLGTIPLLIDGNVRLTESAAIPQYLATRYGPTALAVDVGEADYGLWLDWMHRSEATLTFPLTIVLRYSQFEPERRLQQAADDYSRWFLSRLRHLTRALSDREWLCAGRFTMADLCVGYALLLARNLHLESKFSSEISAYWDRISVRPGFLAARAAQGQGNART